MATRHGLSEGGEAIVAEWSRSTAARADPPPILDTRHVHRKKRVNNTNHLGTSHQPSRITRIGILLATPIREHGVEKIVWHNLKYCSVPLEVRINPFERISRTRKIDPTPFCIAR